MLKKIMSLLVCLTLAACSLASAETIPTDQYFEKGKTALGQLAAGQTDEALSTLAFSYASPDDSDEKFLQFVRDYLPDLSADTVQRDVAVCYWETLSGLWLLAIPISEPVSDDVMALVLMSSDLQTFSGYAALSWAEVNEGTATSDWVWWNVEYDPGSAVLYADS